jgi:hypothetical protein
VAAIELVSADGRLVLADRENERDLFCSRSPRRTREPLWYPIERGPEVLHAWREVTQSDLPDELTESGSRCSSSLIDPAYTPAAVCS